MEAVDFIILFLATFLSTYIYICIYRRLSEINKTFTTKEYVIVFVISILTMVNNIFNPLLFKILTSILNLSILYKLIFKDSWKNIIYYVLLITLISIAIELVCSILISFVANSVYIFNNQAIYKFLFSIFYIYIIYLIFRIKLIIIATKKLKAFWLKEKSILYLIVITILFINLFMIFYNIDYQDFKYYFTVSLFVILLIILFNNYFKNIYTNESLKVKTSYLESCISNYAQTIEDYKILKHNFINEIILLRTYANNTGKTVADQIINNYNKDLNWVNNLKNIPPGIQGLIYSKIASAKTQKIVVYVENQIDINIKNIKANTHLNTCEILGIALDNAIESAQECKEKLIYLNFIDNKSNFTIEIINTFCNDIDLNKIGNKRYSTKKRKSGLGLKYIFTLNKNINIKNYIVDNLFKILIKIEKN